MSILLAWQRVYSEGIDLSYGSQPFFLPSPLEMRLMYFKVYMYVSAYSGEMRVDVRLVRRMLGGLKVVRHDIVGDLWTAPGRDHEFLR